MADIMEFPKTMQEFVESYSFIDIDEVYTNGIMLVPTFRVKQAIEHYEKEIRENAIDECYMKAKTMMEELSYQNQGRRNGKTHRLYCIQALEFLRQVAEQMKGVQNGRFD